MRLADSSDTSSNPTGDLGRYLAGRERNHGLLVPRDPEAAVEALAELLGGRFAARGWLRTALDIAEAPPRYWRDHHGNRVSY